MIFIEAFANTTNINQNHELRMIFWPIVKTASIKQIKQITTIRLDKTSLAILLRCVHGCTQLFSLLFLSVGWSVCRSVDRLFDDTFTFLRYRAAFGSQSPFCPISLFPLLWISNWHFHWFSRHRCPNKAIVLN